MPGMQTFNFATGQGYFFIKKKLCIVEYNRKNSIPFYDRCGWHSCPKHKLRRAFVDGLIDNVETYPIQD